MTREGMACDFVGHPVVAEPQATEAEAAAFRADQGLGNAPVALVLPGSRAGEVARLSAVFGEALGRFSALHPGLRIVVPAASAVAEQVKEAVRSWPVDTIVLDPRGQDIESASAEKRAAFRAADIALAASGTVSLELAAARTPMVIAYRMHWRSFYLIRRMALVDTVTLVNLVSDTRVVPDFLGPDCTADKIAGGLDAVLRDPHAQEEAMELTMQRLGEGGEAPGLRAARAVLRGMQA